MSSNLCKMLHRSGDTLGLSLEATVVIVTCSVDDLFGACRAMA